MLRKKVLIWLNIVSVENLEVTEALRDYVVSKLEKSKIFPSWPELDARVNLKVYREKQPKLK